MVWIGNRLRRLGGVKSTKEEARAAPHQAPADPGPPLLMLLPDAVGIASYGCLAFPDAETATAFIDDRFRGHIEDGMIAFWALTRDPNSGGRRTVVEPLLIIRDAKRLGVVYPFSFTDTQSAYAFIRGEMEHGLELRQVALYWAVTVNASVDSWGKSSVSPPLPPATAKATTPAEAGAAPAPDDGERHLPLLETWESGRRGPLGGPTRVVRRQGQSPARDAGTNGTPDPSGSADGAFDRPLKREPVRRPEENLETNGTAGSRQLPQEPAELTEDVTPIAPRNGHRPLAGGDPAEEAVTRAIEEALQIVRGERKRRHPRPELLEDEASAGGGETDVSDCPPRAADGAGHEGPPDRSGPDDDLDESALHEMIDEIERFRRRQRWEDQQGPFRGFGSPPGKF